MRLSCFPSPHTFEDKAVCAGRRAAVPSAGEILKRGRSGEVSASTYASHYTLCHPD